MLLRLARGSGLAGIGAMARVSGAAFHAPVMRGAKGSPALVRPLLDVAKARLIATLRAAGIAHVEDPSNDDPRYTRVRWRKLAPVLAAEGLTAQRLVLLARRVRRNEAAIEAVVTAAFDRLGSRPAARTIAFDAGGLRDVPAEIVLRLIGRAAAEVGDEGPVELGKLEAMCESLAGAFDRSAGRFRRTLAGAMVSLQRDRLIVERAPPRRRRPRVETMSHRRRETVALRRGRSRMRRYIRRNGPGLLGRGSARTYIGSDGWRGSREDNSSKAPELRTKRVVG